MKTCSPEKENKLLASDCQLSCRWQCVARRAGHDGYCRESLTSEKFFKKPCFVFVFLSGMSSCIFCIYFLSLVLVSGLNLWTYVPCITKIITVRFLCFKTNVCSLICNPGTHSGVMRVLWVLRNIFGCQHWVGSNHLNCSISFCFSKLKHGSYLESVGQARKNKYEDILFKDIQKSVFGFEFKRRTPGG